jgi:hypothetical protein
MLLLSVVCCAGQMVKQQLVLTDDSRSDMLGLREGIKQRFNQQYIIPVQQLMDTVATILKQERKE